MIHSRSRDSDAEAGASTLSKVQAISKCAHKVESPHSDGRLWMNIRTVSPVVFTFEAGFRSIMNVPYFRKERSLGIAFEIL